MMDALRGYILGIVSVGLICSIIFALSSKSPIWNGPMKLLCALVMTLCLVEPLAGNRLRPFFQNFTGDFHMDAQSAIDVGTAAAEKQFVADIKQRSQAYILDKAAALDLKLNAQIEISDQKPYAPESIILTGEASPYAKARMNHYISQDLGIEEDAIVWQ